MTKLILCNGPKSCGKDTAIDYMISKGLPLVRRECKDILHKLTMMMFNVLDDRYWQIYNDRSLKEVPLPEFSAKLPYSEICKIQELTGIWPTKEIFGSHRNVELTIRNAMIYVSEIIIKPRFGESYFGQVRASSILDNEIAVDSSCGFIDELYPAIDKLGQDNILLVRIHREGFTFEGDSRSYIPDGIIHNTIDIYNVDEQVYLDEVYRKVKGWLDE